MNDQKTKEKPQRQRFKETAKELECDESEEAFEKDFEKIVPPQKGEKDKKPSKG